MNYFAVPGLGVKPTSKKVKAETVLLAISNHFKVSIVDLKSKSRKKEIAFARHVAIYTIVKHSKLVYREVGSLLSGRDHTTIINSMNIVKNFLSHKNDTADKLAIRKFFDIYNY